MKLSTSSALLIDQKKDALIVFYQGKNALLPRGNNALKKLCDQWTASSAFKGEAGQTAVFPAGQSIAAERVILAGLGELKHFHNGLLEQAAAAATRAGWLPASP